MLSIVVQHGSAAYGSCDLDIFPPSYKKNVEEPTAYISQRNKETPGTPIRIMSAAEVDGKILAG